MKKGTSGPAVRLAALDASLCLGFRRNSGEFRNSTELKRHNKRAEKRPARHAIPPTRWKLHCRFCRFPSCRLPAACLLCGRLPHRAPLVLQARPRAVKNILATPPPPTNKLCLVGEFTPRHSVARPSRGLCFLAGDNEHHKLDQLVLILFAARRIIDHRPKRLSNEPVGTLRVVTTRMVRRREL